MHFDYSSENGVNTGVEQTMFIVCFDKKANFVIALFGYCFQMRFRSPRFVSLPSGHSFAAILPGDSVAGLVVTNGIINFLNIYNTLLIVRLVLTWFPNSPPAIVSPLRYNSLCIVVL